MEQNTTIFLSVCDKAVTAEVGCDLAMPDYQPEIRRLLRVRATVLPPSSYVGGGKAEFMGAVRYDVLYSGNDGGLYSVTATENYQLSAPLDKDADVDLSDEIPVFCDPLAESVTGRVTAPRKLSLRCRVRGQIRAFGRHRLGERLVGDVPTVGVERLAGESLGAIISARATESVMLSDEITTDGSGDLRVICGEATAAVSEALPLAEGVGCRGEVFLKLLVCRDGEESLPYTLTRRVPFAATVPCDAADGLCYRATAKCTELSAEVTEDGRVLCDLSLTVIAEGQGNLPVYYTEDLFAADRECGASYAEYRFPKAARCISGNFTQSVYEPLGSFGLDGDCEVLDAHVTSAVDGVTYDRGKWVLTGESRVGLLMRTGDEYATHDLLLPFRYETDGEGGEPMLTAADVQTVSVRSRVDGGRLGLECEMAVSARICVAQKLVALSEAVFGETLEKPAEMVVAFPERGETLWSLAKRYHTPIAALAKLNATPSNPLTVLKAGEPMVVNE